MIGSRSVSDAPLAAFGKALAGLGKPVPFFTVGGGSTELSLFNRGLRGAAGFLVAGVGGGATTAFVAAAFALVVRATVGE